MKNAFFSLLAVAFAGVAPWADATQADDATILVVGQQPGPKPFINKLRLTVSNLAVLDRVQFAIAPKPSSATRPISATYKRTYLGGRGYVDLAGGRITVPVFGLYADYANTVKLTYYFNDGSSRTANTTVVTEPYADPCGLDNHAVLQARTASKDLSYDFMLMTTNCSTDSPAVLDTDGAIRWVGTAGVRNYVSTFFNNSVILSNDGLLRIDLDGRVTRIATLASLGAVGLHHSIDPGKFGMMLDINTEDWVESVNVEVDASGRVLKKWMLGDIIRQAMIEGGDDPAPFVRNAQGQYNFHAFADWFHNNSVSYRRSDDSLIISSRENFVICIDYETSAIKWILGDPTKQWYQYPSLRRFALTLTPGGHYPIGQHAVNVTRDDQLLLFDNGQRSQNHAPYGASRNYSAPRRYGLDLVARTATEVWNYPNGQTVRAPFQSSAYEDAPFNYLFHYDFGQQRVIGLSASGAKVFDYRYPLKAFRSVPVHWENLTFPETNARLGNISARSQINTGDDVAITGFILSGTVPKTLVLRGLGPSLADAGQSVPGRLMDPLLELHNSSGQLLQVNDDYRNGPNVAEISAAGLAPSDDKEAALLARLAPGAYTAVVRGVNDTTGLGVAEVYDISPQSPTSLANVSARAFTSTGDRVLIGGLILQGSAPKRVLFRALGPELQNFGITNALPDPTLELYGADGVKIASNDNWRDATNAAEVERTGIAPPNDSESAILIPLRAGNYTFIARGSGETEGIATVEAYRLD